MNMRNSKRNLRLGRRGAAVVEFAICAPVIMLVFVGMIEFGRMMMVQHVVTLAAREGARESVLISATQTSVETIVAQDMATVGVGPDDHAIVISPSLSSAGAGDTITVTVSVPISSITALGTMWFGHDYILDSAVSMRKEGFD